MSVTLSPISNTAVIYKSDDTNGFLRKLAALVAQIYVTFSQISQNERNEVVKLELKFKKHSFESADLMRAKGNLGLGFACISVILFGASVGFANTNDTKFIQLVSEKCPDVVRLFDSSREGKIKSQETLASLESIRLQDKNNKSQTDGNIKEQFAQALQAEIQRLRSASASSN
jgi:hypothetical protein